MGKKLLSGSALNIMQLLAGDGKSGSDILALEVGKGLKRRGHRIIWGSHSGCPLVSAAGKSGFEFYDMYPSGSFDMSGVKDFVRFCRKENVHVVNAHHSHSRHILLRAKLGGLKSRSVFTRHCVLRTAPVLGGLAHNFLVDKQIAVSNIVRRSLSKSGIVPSKTVTIYNGVDTEKFSKIAPGKIVSVKEEFWKPGAINVGMVARLQHGIRFTPAGHTLKGHEVAFRALAEIHEDVNLLLLGPWKQEDIEKLKLIAAYHQLDLNKITFCGFRDEIAPFYKIMDICILPSPDEGFGLSLVEAMAAGVPCIGADGGGIREIISDGVNGFLIRPGDSRALAAKIRHLALDGQLRDRFAENGRARVSAKFDIERTIGETEELFHRLTG